MAEDNVAVRLRRIRAQFANHTALEGVTADIREGEFVALVGPTGCGKSTLLNIVAGLALPSSGDVQVFGETINGPDRRTGYLFQQDALLPWKTALDNVAAGLVFRGEDIKAARTKAQTWIDKVHLRGFENHYPHQLSGGMKKRVGLAQILILDPNILLMDEPFSALDIQTRNLMENELLKLWQENKKTVLFVTHDLEEAIAMADRVLVLSAGPRASIIGDFIIPLARPRDVMEIRLTESFLEIYRRVWDILRGEVLKTYARQE